MYNVVKVKTQETKYLTIQEKGKYNHLRIYKTVHGLTVSVLTGHGDYIRTFYNLEPVKVPSLVRSLKKSYMEGE